MRGFHNFDTFITGQVVNIPDDTAQQLPGHAVPDGCEVVVIANPNNTGTVYVAPSKAVCENASGRFDGLTPGLAIALPMSNTSAIWVLASVSGEAVSYTVPAVA
jgi:hypothetical protein